MDAKLVHDGDHLLKVPVEPTRVGVVLYDRLVVSVNQEFGASVMVNVKHLGAVLNTPDKEVMLAMEWDGSEVKGFCTTRARLREFAQNLLELMGEERD